MKRLIVGLSAVVGLLATGCSTSDSTTKTSEQVTTTTAAAAATTAAASSTTAAPAGDTTTTTAAPKAGAHPFTGLDAFCKTAPPAVGLKATGNGVTADTITVVHMRQELEKLEPIGFAVPVGDTDDIVKTFAKVINDCGGINGRKLDIKTVTYDPLKPETLETVCVRATEDIKTFGIISGTGWQGPTTRCASVDKKAVIVSSTAGSQETMTAAAGRYITVDILQEDALKVMVDYLLSKKLLDGKKIGVVASSYNATDKPVKTALVDYLKSKNMNVVAFEVLDCTGALCNQGHQPVVENLKAAGVDVVFPTMNLLTLPYFVKEASVQGFKPTFYQSNYNSMGGDLTNSMVAKFGGEESGVLYNGATIIDFAATGFHRKPGAKVDPFSQMCNDTYAKATTTGAKFDFVADNTKYGMVASMCSQIRIMARAAFDAGPDLTPDTWAAAAGKLGKVDMNGGIPGTLSGKKVFAPDEVRVAKAVFPCPEAAFPLCVAATDEPTFKITV
jgi:Periplasmic binding protein